MLFLTQDENIRLNSLRQQRKPNENKNTKKYKDREAEIARLQRKSFANRTAHERQQQQQPQSQQPEDRDEEGKK